MKYVFIFIALLAVFLAAGHFFARKTVTSEVTINAPAEKIWAVIDDTNKYPEWNPSMQVTDGTVAVGNIVDYQFTDSAGTQSKITATVKEKTPNQLLHQSGGIPTVITYQNYWRLTPINANTTKVSITEDYAGVYVWFWNPETVEKAYELQNEALKKRVELLN